MSYTYGVTGLRRYLIKHKFKDTIDKKSAFARDQGTDEFLKTNGRVCPHCDGAGIRIADIRDLTGGNLIYFERYCSCKGTGFVCCFCLKSEMYCECGGEQ